MKRAPTPPEEFDDLLTPREVAEIFGVRTTTIARWARAGKLAPLRTPGGRRDDYVIIPDGSRADHTRPRFPAGIRL
jgi:excisionase family DNA binding protein